MRRFHSASGSGNPEAAILPQAPFDPGSVELRYLDPARIRFFRAGATLRLTVDGEFSCLQVAVVRVFPLSNPSRYFSVRDGGGKKMGLLTDLMDLDPESRLRVEEELERRYLVARLKRVIRVRERFGIVEWDVETDRGECRFSTRDLRETVIRLPGHHYVIIDVEGNRFEIQDLNALDDPSQAWLIRYM